MEMKISDLMKSGWRAEAGRRLLPYDLFKWWGRRPALIIDALLLDAVGVGDSAVKDVIESRLSYRPAQVLKGHVVCDPMCGGGTTIVEALFLGAKEILCSDIDPASAIVVKAMIKILENCNEVYSILLSIAKSVYEELKDFWCINDYCYVHTFLTRRCYGDYCYVPKWLGTFRVRGSVVKVVIDERGELYEDENVSIRDLVKIPKNRLVEVRRGVYAYAVELYSASNEIERHFVSLVKNDFIAEHLSSMQKKAEKSLYEVCTPITDGRETRRLLRGGITCWEQIFTPRQLLTLVKFLMHVKQEAGECLDVAVALVGTVTRTASMLAFYYQPYAKVNPGLVIKSFWLPLYPVELNPVAGDVNKVKTVGRGTIFTYIQKLRSMCSKLRGLNSNRVVKRVVVEIRDALDISYENCNIVILDPPYPGKIAYSEVTQVYTIPYSLLGMQPPEPAGNAINIYGLDGYINSLENLIAKILREAPNATLYLLMSNDKRGETVVNTLAERLKQKSIVIERLGTVIGEAPGALGRGKTKEIIVIRIKKVM
uniref:Uncharacterized protein n=1 Tax=Ignisphaera aggregans TaxID=334771 RepID=A0A7J2TCJ1_9CREN